MKLDFSAVLKYSFMFAEGMQNTLLLALFTVLFGLFLGTLLAVMRIGKLKVIRILSGAYIEFIRGTPLLVQILIIMYGLPAIGFKIPEMPWIRSDFPRFASAVIALSVNSSAYVAEIIRSGIQSVDKGQTEAARCLGLSGGTTMFKIILPQAIKNILPALGNEFVTIIKESSVVMVIGISDLMFKAGTIASINYRYMESYMIVAVIYFALTFTTSRLVALLERRLKASER